MLYDLFICHASEDKQTIVRPLADALRAENVEVWYDEFSLKLGDSIRRSLDKGLRHSRFGIVVLSKAFFGKEWPQYELDGLVEREMAGKDKVILPVWHEISHDEVMSYSPSLAGRKAVSSSKGLDQVVSEILSVVHPQGSPLIVARDTMLEWGLTPPVITDQYWLDVVEASNRMPAYGAVIPEASTWGRWSFPLPSKEGSPKQWGDRLAWTAMQLDWVRIAEEIPISIITPPEQILSFIDSHPGLFETCVAFPSLLAEYAPQLTIPGLGGDLESTIEEEYQKSCEKHRRLRDERSTQGSALTTNNKSPLCDEEWSLRHPSFGDYEPAHVANNYFAGGMFGPEVSPYGHTDHLFWLLSESSSWIPTKIHYFLLEGMKNWPVWTWDNVRPAKGHIWHTCGRLFEALYDAVEDEGSFTWNEQLLDDLFHRIQAAIHILNLRGSPEDISKRFISQGFAEAYINNAKTSRGKKKKRKGK